MRDILRVLGGTQPGNKGSIYRNTYTDYVKTINTSKFRIILPNNLIGLPHNFFFFVKKFLNIPISIFGIIFYSWN